MSRTKRSYPSGAKEHYSCVEDVYREWVTGEPDEIHQSAITKWMRQTFQYNSKIGRDGGYRSACYTVVTYLTDDKMYYNNWYCDGVISRRTKRDAKRHIAKTNRRHGKKIITRILFDEDAGDAS